MSATEHFQQVIDSAVMSVDVIAAPIEVAAAGITRSLMEGGTLYCCAIGCDRSLAQLTADRLMYPVDSDRPALPALALPAAVHAGGDDSPWRDARALIRDGDSVLCIDSSPDGGALRQAIAAVADRHVQLFGLTHTGINDVDSAGKYTIIALPGDTRSHLLGMQALALNCLCSLIEHELFGDS
ncbi:MAG: hypothetical protein RIC38_05765 [Chromatocurvus sp.]